MIVFLNGRFVPEEEAVVSVFDRGFTYGDGLFETLRVSRGCPFLWQEHLDRLEAGARVLKIPLPLSAVELRAAADELIRRNDCPECVLRVHLSRGPGPRGYATRGVGPPTLVMSVHPLGGVEKDLKQWKLIVSSFRLTEGSQVSGCKTANKLIHILAREEAESQGCHDAVLLNTAGEVVETTCANLFWIRGQTILTPPLSSGALPGITRGWILRRGCELGLECGEETVQPVQLRTAEGCFVTNSVLGIVEIVEMDGQPLRHSELTRRLHRSLAEAVAASE